MLPLAISDDNIAVQTSHETWAGCAAAFANAVRVTGHNLISEAHLTLKLCHAYRGNL